ncbi:MAG: hypothetical protein ABI870_05395 [Rhodanobacter sp.]
MKRISGFLATALSVLCVMPVCASETGAGANFLTPVFHAGARFDNVFSRTISIRANGFDEAVHRVSGSASYRVLKNGVTDDGLQISYRYDGMHEGTGANGFRDGGAISCFDGKCTPNTDASGLAYNPVQWGKPPATLHVGQRWSVDIVAPWELGTPGRQTVTVMAVDPVDQSATLKREGHGDGAYAGETLQTKIIRHGKSYDVTIEPGHSHWYGYTTFHHGIVISDELMVERPVTLVSRTLGRIAASERQYILLNAMPIPDEAEKDNAAP